MKEENPMNGETVPSAETYIEGESVRERKIPTERETVREREIPTERETVREREIPTERETVRERKIPTERETVREREIPTENETVRDGKAKARKKEPTPTEKLERRMRRYEHSMRDYQFFLLRLLLLFLVIWVMFFKVVGVMRMPSADMYPRIDAGDMLLFYRLDTDVRAQDVAVLQKVTPEGELEVFVGRVVAVAGDTVDIGESGRLRVNGNSMIESNIFYDTYPYENYTEFPLTLTEGQCFILADSRDGGSDSRYYGPVEREELLGTVITVLRRNNL